MDLWSSDSTMIRLEKFYGPLVLGFNYDPLGEICGPLVLRLNYMLHSER